MAQAYELSPLSLENGGRVDAELAQPEVPNTIILKELRTKKATSTGFFFCLFTILKVWLMPWGTSAPRSSKETYPCFPPMQ